MASPGVSFELMGDANDYVGKGLRWTYRNLSVRGKSVGSGREYHCWQYGVDTAQLRASAIFGALPENVSQSGIRVPPSSKGVATMVASI